jgi:hypothetical protein
MRDRFCSRVHAACLAFDLRAAITASMTAAISGARLEFLR